ncbi:PREDICTED: golgin subfamily A member 4-like isoform X1 [Trachymyrmex septentrionalis]|uniref:golgin subfamily A member 4-like isoform X1 n=1 Tax=Trachymyrmex septentrionalis TaxID=34720 RepID=UPI00084EFBB5|nr:PREDICTED: golgin subfamily A member 4-like isoform X1 [Trachymyrmex septentrionalis]
MFKKFKDKLAEEMKQSPARLQASVQQLAQAVVSPALSNSSIQEVSASNDNFSLTEDGDETPKNTPVKHSFQNVDLMSPSPNRMEISRRSSVSSITSDASSLFPMYESPPNLYHLQSDMDQSASEMDDNISPHLDKVTKDQLYSAYKKVQTKYHKYRGRYTDLATHYRELDRVKSRLESVLVETQDKVLRRITDLKEQCQLEQQAKAHLEDVLRNDIEEKDHIINTLNTKIKLLQSSGPILDNSVLEEAQPKESSKGNLIDLANESSNDENNALSVENTQLKDKLKKLESLVLKYKESLKRNKEKFLDVMKEKNTLENDHEALKNSTAERISVTENELSAARIQIEKLTEQIDTLHKREEESAISLAENKLSVHRELEEKEEQIKQLRIDLKHVTEDKENLNETVARYKADLSELKSLHIDSDKNAIASKENIEAIKSMQQVGIKHHEEVDHSEKIKIEDENKLDEVTVRLKEKEIELQELQDKLDEMEKQTIEYKCDRESIQSELLAWKTTYSDLREEYQAHRIIAEERQKDADSTIEKLQATVQSVDKELENMRNALIDRDQVCENYNKKMQQYTDMLEEAKNKLTEQKAEIISLNDKLEKCSELQEELENKKTELKAIQNEFELCKSTIDDFKNKVQADSSVINLLKKERSDFINRLIYYNDCIHCLKQDYMVIKNVVAEEFLNQKAKILDMSASLATCFTKFEEENITLRSEIDELRSKIKDQEQLIVKETDLQSEFVRVANHKSALEAELRKSNERLKEMMLKSNQYDELNTTNNKLIAEIDNLNFKIHDLETTSHKLTQSQQEVKVLRERLRTLENLESVNHALSVEIDDLREKHAQASHAFKKVDELNAKLREATEVINSFKSENSNQDTLRKELYASRLEIAHLKEDLAEKEGEIKTRDEKLASEEEHVAHLKSTCDSHIQTIEEHVRKYLNLEAEYQATRENHAKETTELMENNKALQETINVKLVQLKKMKTIKERQNKTIEEVKAELDQSKTRQAELSKMLEIFKKQTESLKLENSQLVAITLENKDLKDQQNDLLNRNQTLCENDEVLKQKISDYEKEIEELRRTVKNYVESYKSQLNSQSEKAERLSNELNNVSAQLERKDAELNSLNERLMMSEKESQEIKGKLDERDVELKDKIFELGTVMTNGNVMKEENSRLCAELRTLKDEVKRIKDVEEKNKKLKSELNDLIQKNSGAEAIRSENNMLIAEQKTLKDRIAELERVKSSSMQLQTHVNNLQSKISSLEALRMENSRLQSEIEALQSAKSSSPEMGALKDTLTAKDAEIKLLEDKISNMSQEIGNLKRFSLEIDERRKGTDTLRNSLASAEEKITSLQSEINSLIRMNDALKKELETIRKDKDAKGQLISDTLREENKRLEAQLDEALITFQAKETQMQLANNELRSQTSQLREQLKTSEEEQGMRLKQLVKEFQAQLHDKEEELQAALEKRFDRQHNYESNLVQQYKEQLKDCQIELTEKSEQLESLVLEKKDVIAEKGKDIDRLVETIAQIKKEHTDEIKELEKKWKAIVQQKIDNLQVKHEDELNELTKEWQNERKPDAQTEAASEELESTSRVAMAAIHTSTGSIHTLQQTLTSQRRELAELRKLVSLRHDTLEDSTEIEYLRNILFEYMMGRETMVLARVIAAVVKFDQEQTTKILKKEEDKLTLFGSLGLS